MSEGKLTVESVAYLLRNKFDEDQTEGKKLITNLLQQVGNDILVEQHDWGKHFCKADTRRIFRKNYGVTLDAE